MRTWITAAVVLCGLMTLSGNAQTTAPPKDAPEMVVNGDFAAGTTGWSVVAEGNAQGSIQPDEAVPVSATLPHALRLTVTRLGRRCGIANSGPGGMNVQPDAWYDAVFYARTENNRRTGFVFSLESGNGKTICARTTLPEIGGEWQQYTVSLHTRAANPKARLVISPVDPGVQWLGALSLRLRTSVPADAQSSPGTGTI